MSETSRYNTGPKDIIEYIKSLENRVSALEQMPRLQSASIDSGGVTVKTGAIRVMDETGSIRLIMGLLPDGNYGINVKENGQNNFHEVPYVYSNFIGTGETATSILTYQDLATVGPTVDVSVGSSGRILVIATAQIQYLGSAGTNITQGGAFDVAFSGANTRNPVTGDLTFVGIWDQNIITTTNNTFVNIATITAQSTFEGLTPGVTTVTMKYRRVTNAASNTDFFRRGLTVVRL